MWLSEPFGLDISGFLLPSAAKTTSSLTKLPPAHQEQLSPISPFYATPFFQGPFFANTILPLPGESLTYTWI